MKLYELKFKIKEIINEEKYNIYRDEELLKSIEKYVAWNDFNDLKYLEKIKNNFRDFKKAPVLYRGMFLSDEELNNLQNDNFSIDRASSWTSDESVAKSFIIDPKYITKNKNKKNKVILKGKFTNNNIYLNIYDYIMWLNINKKSTLDNFDELAFDSVKNEKETIVGPVKLNKKNLYKIL